jgi:transcriptional regulator GlxA family with amidase domain
VSPRVQPRWAVHRAAAFMRTHAGTPITLDGIAAASGVSGRALQYGFRRYRTLHGWPARR